MDSVNTFNETTHLQSTNSKGNDPRDNMPATSGLLARFNALPSAAKVAYVVGGVSCIASFITFAISAGMSHSCAHGNADDCSTGFMLHPLAGGFFVASYGAFKIGDASR